MFGIGVPEIVLLIIILGGIYFYKSTKKKSSPSSNVYATIRCPNCGQYNRIISTYCRNCGCELKKTDK